jgi:Tfp pilus assembly protein PilP
MYAWRDGVRFEAILTVIAFLVLTGCDDAPRGPTTEDFSRERKELLAKVAKKKKSTAKAGVAKTAPAEPVEPAFGAVGTGFTYDRTGMRDPFRSFEWEEKSRLALDIAERGPLEQYDVNQLSLLAVVWNTGTARALVQDPAGNSYIVGEGTRIGKNEGRVIAIDDNLIVVKETYVDFLGQETTKDIEMRIRRSEGG